MMKLFGRLKNAARSHRYLLAAGAAAVAVLGSRRTPWPQRKAQNLTAFMTS